MVTNATVLMNEAVTIEGYTIWGSPMTIQPGGAFAVPHAPDRARIYATIPQHTDILVTHVPPYGVLDGGDERGMNGAGDVELRRAVLRVRPQLHIFGHAHANYGVRPTARTLFVNAAMLDQFGGVDRKPIVLDLHAPKG
jgi:Icc-related predicted phosphoesterase